VRQPTKYLIPQASRSMIKHLTKSQYSHLDFKKRAISLGQR